MTDPPRSSWNYRVLRRHSESGRTWLEIREVYYLDGKPELFSLDPPDLDAGLGYEPSEVPLRSDEAALKELKLMLDRIGLALEEPILDERTDVKS